MKKIKSISALAILISLLVAGCSLPRPERPEVAERSHHNYIVLVDLSDRLIVQENQPGRDKEIIKDLYSLFEGNVRENLYIKSEDEIKVVIAPQVGDGLSHEVFEDRLYVNMSSIPYGYRKTQEVERRENFMANLDTLYNEAVFSTRPEAYHGADIWKYFYENLKVDYSDKPNVENYLFILTDGYPIVGRNQNKLYQIQNEFPDLHVVLLEAAPREKEMEWDNVMAVWEDWFTTIGIKDYTLIKRGSITKELEQVAEIVNEKPLVLTALQ